MSVGSSLDKYIAKMFANKAVGHGVRLAVQNPKTASALAGGVGALGLEHLLSSDPAEQQSEEERQRMALTMSTGGY